MKRRDLERHLRAHGCSVDREGAEHSWWAAKGGKPRTAIPRHREIRHPLTRKICRDLGVPPPSGSR
ncbi:MAG: type II toxin-antitoxin system HicA family toxin [Actinobacteria bacterium]|nr:type II toxin-antitoxin system HicA family toxin [Actinomycetota bacterium]